MTTTNDRLMYELLKAKDNGEQITFTSPDETEFQIIADDHTWDLNNTYKIRERREFIIKFVGRSEPIIQQTNNNWTRSDFGKFEFDIEFVLMREIFQEEM